jgi:hypothetical protein
MAEDRTPRTVGPSEATGDPLDTPEPHRRRRERAPRRHRERARSVDNFPEIGGTIPDEATGPPARRIL